MEGEKEKISSFRDLYAWQEGHMLVLGIYKATEMFPKSELFGLTNQLRRAVVSITSNIAEGFARKSGKEKIQFYYIAKGSITEIQNQLLISWDLKYINDEIFFQLAKKTVATNKLICGLIRKIKSTE